METTMTHKGWQNKAVKNSDTLKEYTFIPIGLPVALNVKMVDCEPMGA